MTRRVLVVGAGVAGLATARALRGAGFEVTVVERRPGAPLPGLGLNLPGNAVRAFGALGVAEEVLAAGIPVTRRSTVRRAVGCYSPWTSPPTGPASRRRSACAPVSRSTHWAPARRYAAASASCASTPAHTVRTSPLATARRRSVTSSSGRTAYTPPCVGPLWPRPHEPR